MVTSLYKLVEHNSYINVHLDTLWLRPKQQFAQHVRLQTQTPVLNNAIIYRSRGQWNVAPNSDQKGVTDITAAPSHLSRDVDYEHPPVGKRWNVFAHHAMYNRTRFHQLMAPNSRYT
ncbi:Hypp4612 [Branchiostoma lanceolatum]|uniref:Hypp4612 protein n=1 Tax=Branchiostoma lanceolatum TaxID=7740 RepID=A0A8K0EYK0_BRALA|nr:Hypp4612 [Branchiostoma lanceolatum]